MKLAFSLALAGFGGFLALAATTPTALAIDCLKATSSTEKAICADPKAKAADDAMVAAFSTFKASLKPPQQKVLVANQADWIATRDLCSQDENGQEQTNQEKIAACVIRQSGDRQEFLLGQPLEGPGLNDPLVPVIREGTDKSFFTSFDFAAPATAGEKLFNATLDGEMKKYHLAKTADDYTDGFAVTLKYASPELLSAYIEASDQSPTLAHPMDNTHNLNIDMRSGKILTIKDTFDKNALARLEDTCLSQLKDYMANDSATGDVAPELIRADIESLATWSFGASEATLIFDQVDTDPSGVCRLPYADLRKVIKPGFPLPQ